MTPHTTLSRSVATPLVTTKPYTTLVLVITDLIALLLSVALSVGIKALWVGNVDILSYLQLAPFLVVFLIVYAAVGLYSGLGIGAPEELRRSTISSTILFLFLAAATVSLRGAKQPFKLTLFLAVLFSVALVPLMRECARQLYAREPWWGYPAVIFGAGRTGAMVVRALLNDPGLGLKPLAVLDDDAEHLSHIEGVPMMGPVAMAPTLLEKRRPAYAVFAMPDIPHDQLVSMIELYGTKFSHVLVIPELTGFSSLWVDSKSVGGMIGLEVRQQVLLPDYAVLKRIIDLVFIVFGSIVVLPLCTLIACSIKLDSRGPVFYGQTRIGRNGRRFKAWKFRSMVSDADHVLEEQLARNPELREEWDRDHKLRNDPRITRVGKFLRRSSLDEFPQLWNVLLGEMSLVGPRPIVDKEVVKYGSAFELYKRVNGGLTGLWQVSGRNDLTYDERVYLDLFYVRNWSVWLDFCILFRTIAVVLFSKGAY